MPTLLELRGKFAIGEGREQERGSEGRGGGQRQRSTIKANHTKGGRKQGIKCKNGGGGR